VCFANQISGGEFDFSKNSTDFKREFPVNAQSELPSFFASQKAEQFLEDSLEPEGEETLEDSESKWIDATGEIFLDPSNVCFVFL
jgi:hypothetical protein